MKPGGSEQMRFEGANHRVGLHRFRMWLSGRRDRFAAAAGFALLLVNSGCATRPFHPADVVLPDAHAGGSALAVHPNETLFASGGWAGWVRLWSLPEGDAQRSWRAHAGEVKGLVFPAGGERLISAGYDGRIVIWSLEGEPLHQVQSVRPLTAFAADNRSGQLATGHGTGEVHLWRMADLTELAGYSGPDSAVWSIALDGQRGNLAAGFSDRSVEVRRATGEPLALPRPPSAARSLAFSPDGERLYGAGWFHLYRWALAEPRLQIISTEHRGIITDISFGPQADYIASISRQTDSAVLLVDPESGATLRRLQPHDLCGAAVNVSPSGSFLISTSDDASVRIWRLDQGP